MEFLKKHYEKIILSIVLLGVVIASALLPGIIETRRAELEAKLREIIQETPKAAKPLELARNEGTVKRLKEPGPVKLSGEHNLLNPVKWLRRPDGTLVKVAEDDPLKNLLKVTAIRPLHFKVAYMGPSTSAGVTRFRLQVTDETAPRAGQRRTYNVTAKVEEKSTPAGFVLKEIKGAPEDPTELVFKYGKDDETITVGKDERVREFKRVAGQEADLLVPEENRRYNAVRMNGRVFVAGENYIIIAITETEVTLQSEQTQKRTAISLATAAPSGS